MTNATAEGFGLQTTVLQGSDGLNETHAFTAPIWQTSTFGDGLVRISVGAEDEATCSPTSLGLWNSEDPAPLVP